MARNSADWVRDAWFAAADAIIAALAVAGAVALQARWLAAVAGLWSVLALRQGWLVIRAFRCRVR